MKKEILTEYAEKVYGYAFRRTYSVEEAEDLSQEILLTALSAMDKLTDDAKFEPWLWALAANVTKSFRRHIGKQRAMFTYDSFPEDIAEEADEDCEEEESRIREKIAYLSRAYREIILLHYYDNLGVSEIAERLGLPVGTVTWRLSEARKKLKKEYISMDETVLRPKTLHIDIYGSGEYGGMIPFPQEYIKDALSQNICAYCYEEAHSLEEIVKYCGVPAYYVEDTLENLVKREAVTETAGHKYLTAFPIWTDEFGIYGETYAESMLAPILEPLSEAIAKFTEEAFLLDFYKAGRSEGTLAMLLTVMKFDRMGFDYNRMEYPEHPLKYDGYRWNYMGCAETGAHPRVNVGRSYCNNRYSIYCFGGFGWRTLMPNYIIDGCVEILTSGETKPELLSEMTEEGYAVSVNGKPAVTVPMMTRTVYGQLMEIGDKYFAPLMDAYSQIVVEYAQGYRKLFPAHLQNDAKRLSHDSFINLFAKVAEYCQKKGVFPIPAGEICDVIVY